MTNRLTIARFILSTALTLVCSATTSRAAVGDPTLTGNPGQISLAGLWRISWVSGDADDYWFEIRTSAGIRRLHKDDKDFPIEVGDVSPWIMQVEIDSVPRGCGDTHCDPANILGLDEIDVKTRTFELRLRTNNANSDLTLHLTPASPCTSTLGPPIVQPPLACVGALTSVCLWSWGSISETNTGRPVWFDIGVVSNGHSVEFPGLSFPSNFAGATPVFLASPPPPLPDCNIFVSPAKQPEVSLVVNTNPIACDPGSVMGSMYGEAGLLYLKAHAGIYANVAPADLCLSVHGVAETHEDLFVQTQFPPVIGVFPDPVDVPVVANHTARFTFTVHGTTAGNPPGANVQEGVFFRGSGGPCPLLNCTFQLRPEDWHQPDATGTLRPIDIAYDGGVPLAVDFALAAGVSAGPDPNNPGQPYSATAYSNYSKTATLTGIQIFERTPDNLGPEITQFRILSKSGTQYNQHGAVLNAPISIAPETLEASSRGRIKVSILPTAEFDQGQVDVESLTFGAFGTERSFAFCDRDQRSVQAIGRALSCHFERTLTNLDSGAPIGVLQGRLKDGQYFQGTQTIKSSR